MKNRAILLITGIIILLLQNLHAQEGEADFSRGYYSDLEGYHATGSHTGTNNEEALRLAKAEAIKTIFKEIKRDELFQQMFIESMPQFIIIEASRTTPQGDQVKAEVKVLIDSSAVILQETKYNVVVADMLNRGEELLLEAENNLDQAEKAELNLRMSEALLFYQTARGRCKEVEELLKNINNPTIMSDKSNNILFIKQKNKAFRTRAEEGFVRLEKLEMENKAGEAIEELVKTYDLLVEEKNKIQEVVDANLYIQPFYDLPRSELEGINLEIDKALSMASTVTEKLAFLRNQVPEDRYLLREKVDITGEELKNLEKSLKDMRQDVLREIRDPRLKRQERARKLKEFQAKAGEILAYTFTHEPGDVLASRLYIPVQWNMDDFPVLGGDMEFYVRAEKAFHSGFWVRSQFTAETIELLNAARTRSLAQEFSLGYFRNRFLFGFGFGWDWIHWLDDGNLETDMERETRIKLYFGGVNANRDRADWLLSLAYEIPAFADPFVMSYFFNLELDLLIRIEHILLIESTLQTHALPLRNDGTWSYDDLEYQFTWQGGAALRFPGPFGWGLYYTVDAAAPVTGAGDLGAFTRSQYWSAFVEYSF